MRAAVAGVVSAHATTFSVTHLNDAGAGSLGDAIALQIDPCGLAGSNLVADCKCAVRFGNGNGVSPD